jgi:16S rRNA processing protein RimM
MPSGSPSDGEPVFLVVGKLRRPHGLRGEILMEVITDFPERLKRGLEIFVGEEHRPLRIDSLRKNDQTILIAFEGFPTPEAVGEFRNQYVYVRAEDRPPLPEGEYYHHQLIGLRVVSEEGQALGTLTYIMDMAGANDVYVITPEHGPEILLPALTETILEVDLERGEMKVHLLPGLLPDE